MPDFEPTGDLVTDVQLAIDNNNLVYITYTDSKGNYSERNVAPLEIRGDRFYAADIAKMALRLFILANVGEYQILDETFDKDLLTL